MNNRGCYSNASGELLRMAPFSSGNLDESGDVEQKLMRGQECCSSAAAFSNAFQPRGAGGREPPGRPRRREFFTSGTSPPSAVSLFNSLL